MNQSKDSIPTFTQIRMAAKRIAPFAHRTPVMQSYWYNQITGAALFFKCENFQKVGAFKFRGACNAILSALPEQAERGIVTHSSGNHAQAVALASRMSGYKATIVMPRNAPKVKTDAVRGYGADIIFCEPTIEARQHAADEIIRKSGALFIHPYNDPAVIAGQGTAAMELLEEVPDLDLIVAPVGGGGLISGTLIAAKSMSPAIRVIGAEPELADDAYRSIHAGTIQPVLRTDTIADGLRTSLGELTFSVMQTYLDDLLTVSEEAIVNHMRTVWERMKIIIEPSCAVPVAAVAEKMGKIAGKKIGIIITGGNVDLDHLPWSK
ncbi:MAG: pyridoxal-phosphate dependent enzyme [Balneolaceae bacterium]|nr:MAG: pyridoxal-phosphate dependent enzyme [Balneolaceae bacterium]